MSQDFTAERMRNACTLNRFDNFLLTEWFKCSIRFQDMYHLFIIPFISSQMQQNYFCGQLHDTEDLSLVIYRHLLSEDRQITKPQNRLYQCQQELCKYLSEEKDVNQERLLR